VLPWMDQLLSQGRVELVLQGPMAQSLEEMMNLYPRYQRKNHLFEVEN